MNRTAGGPTASFAWKLALSAAAIVCVLALLPPSFHTDLPFAFDDVPGRGYVIRSHLGLTLPPELEAGDVLAFPEMSAESRAALLGGNLSEGTQVPIVVTRGGRSIQVTVEAVLNRTMQSTLSLLTILPFLIGCLALGLVTLWRGRDWTAWGLTIFSLGLCIRQLDNIPGDMWTAYGISVASRLWMWGLVLPGLWIAVEHLSRSGLSPRALRGFRVAFVLILLGTSALFLYRSLAMVFKSWTGWIDHPLFWKLLGPLQFAMPIMALVVAYRTSELEQRLRIRWVLWSTALLLASVVAYSIVPGSNFVAHLVLAVTQGLSFFGYLYAVLRHRLVDVSFVVDRALVYGLTTSFVVGVFALVENFIEQTAVGNNASFLLQAGTTLVLALVLNRVHRRVETTVDRLFFRRQRAAVEELQGFARQCAYVEQPARLLELAVECIDRALGGTGVAIYERRDGRYVQIIRRGGDGYPAAVGIDDRAFVALRAEPRATDLDEVAGTALGSGGCLFPMALRGDLSGAIVCGARRAEQFAPDEREALARLAQEVGVALYVLRARERERFVAAVAAGEVADAQVRARELLPAFTATAG